MTDEPATKRDVLALAEAIASLDARVRGHDDRLDEHTQRFDELALLIQNIPREVAKIIDEHHRVEIAALDDKYRAVPDAVTHLRHALDEHVADVHVHVVPTAPKRVRRARTKRR